MLFNCGVGEDLRVPWTARRSNQSIPKEISPEYSLERLMLKLKLQYFATWCEELTHFKRPWCWEKLKVGGEGDDRGWDGWMVSPTQWTWVWVDSGSWWWTGMLGVLQSTGSQRVRHDWATELNWFLIRQIYISLHFFFSILLSYDNIKWERIRYTYFFLLSRLQISSKNRF